MTAVVPTERIERLIVLIRGHKVMLDADLAELYGVETRALTQAVKRNLSRFPADFMFQLSDEEAELLRSQIVISKKGRGGRRYLPYAFTEQGVAMLSSVLNSERAVEINIEIMRAFVRLREMLLSHKDLARKLDALERKFESHDVHIRSLFEAIRQLMTPPEPPKRKIGFLVKERTAGYGTR
ncbi:MAG: ORF6N domain-containing protein [Candidatus Binatia bacterium]